MENATVLFEAWYRSHHPRLVASLAAVFADTEIARDAADEAIVRAFEQWDRVSVMASPAGWTYRVAINVARRRMRRRRIEQLIVHSFRAENEPAPAGELWQIVASLRERQRLAIVLRHLGQLQESEIADVMGITRGGVSSTLRAAYRNLRIAVESEPVEEDVR